MLADDALIEFIKTSIPEVHLSLKIVFNSLAEKCFKAPSNITSLLSWSSKSNFPISNQIFFQGKCIYRFSVLLKCTFLIFFNKGD